MSVAFDEVMVQSMACTAGQGGFCQLPFCNLGGPFASYLSLSIRQFPHL